MSSKNLNFVCVMIVLSLGVFSGFISNSGLSSWYLSLNKPSINPPAYVFGPVWTILYIFMGLALAKIWQMRHEHPALLIIFCIQLILNVLWSPFFFQHHQIGIALIDLMALWFFVMLLLGLSFNHLKIFFLLLPYGLWVSFALFLNYKIWVLN